MDYEAGNRKKVDDAPVDLGLQEQVKQVSLDEAVDESEGEKDLVEGTRFARQLQRAELLDIERSQH